jgi:hypothetical protein
MIPSDPMKQVKMIDEINIENITSNKIIQYINDRKISTQQTKLKIK